MNFCPSCGAELPVVGLEMLRAAGLCPSCAQPLPTAASAPSVPTDEAQELSEVFASEFHVSYTLRHTGFHFPSRDDDFFLAEYFNGRGESEEELKFLTRAAEKGDVQAADRHTRPTRLPVLRAAPDPHGDGLRLRSK